MFVVRWLYNLLVVLPLALGGVALAAEPAKSQAPPAYAVCAGNPFRAENVPEGVTRPGTWSLDTTQTYADGSNFLSFGGFENLQGGLGCQPCECVGEKPTQVLTVLLRQYSQGAYVGCS